MKVARLIDDQQLGGSGDDKLQQTRTGTSVAADRVHRSVLWAAYGDALGWISELTDEKGLTRRTGHGQLERPIEWKRKIGGRTGVTVTLPQGCYSDDSQLRLATCRSIRADGFDVETFSKIELPVWLSYALGGGKSTSAAAGNLSRLNAHWYANTFKGWTDSGGNGAAMRIQPHVWAAQNPGDPSTFLTDVVRNAICTHSHPHGILGAMLHALALAHAMVTGLPPAPEDLMISTGRARNHLDLILDDMEVGQIWLTAFEQEAGAFIHAWDVAVAECNEAIQIVAGTRNLTGAKRYESIVNGLKLREHQRRGSGLLTAIAAIGLTWCEPNAERAMTIAANAVGTDTDTIATMTGAILGISASSEPPVEVMDTNLFRSEADRMIEISMGRNPQSIRYPDLLHWSAPKAQADALVKTSSGGYHVLGLGPVEPQSKPIQSANPGFMWHWVKTSFGQTLLIKRRKKLRVWDEAPESHSTATAYDDNDQRQPGTRDQGRSNSPYQDDSRSRSLLPSDSTFWQHESRSISRQDLQKMIDHLEHHNYDDAKIGPALRSVVNNCAVDQALWFMSVLAERLREPNNPQPR